MIKENYVVFARCSWSDLQPKEMPFSVAPKLENNSTGFLPIFDTLEDAKKAYPDMEVYKITYDDQNVTNYES